MNIPTIRVGSGAEADATLELGNILASPDIPSASPPAVAASPPVAVSPASGDEPKRAYPAPSDLPTQLGPDGLRFDFNDGARVFCPEGKAPWRVILRDSNTGNVLFETQFASGRINSAKRYYIRFRIEVYREGESVWEHDFSARDRNVLIQFPVGTLGDPLGWFPYAVKFKDLHGCKLTCAIGKKLIELFRDEYPDITFIPHEEVQADQFYATYSVGLFFDDKDFIFQPTDFRHVGLHRTAAYILGVDPTEQPPRVTVKDSKRTIAERYVCIAVQSTNQTKYWNNPTGWREVVGFLKEAGYRVICIDQKITHGHELVWNHIPYGAEDQTGDKPLSERVNLLKHADFFVGLSSGLSWLAWAVGTPVVMISGFTHPTNEFETPYRVINYHACNSCWNDPRVRFDHQDFFWCPRHKGSPRQFECTRLITAAHVKSVIKTIPSFGIGDGRLAAVP
jgi:autotransporter strand-loop-strand O-heptosyltransferase